jgi:CopG-like RHH_1 or ribbon-helix-helix domain, RHH_5
MSKKLNAVIPDETWAELDEIAKGEMRTKSQMAAILLAEAIAARRATKARQPEAIVTQIAVTETESDRTGPKTEPSSQKPEGSKGKQAKE